MAKEKPGRRTTIYRMTGVADFKEAIRDKYLEADGFEHQDVEVGGHPGFLVTGAMSRDKAKWCAAVSDLTAQDIEVSGITPAGVILIRIPGFEDDEVVHALTYGMGFQLLEPGKIDNLFGQRIAIRTASPDELRSLTVTTMDERSRTSRSTIPQGDGLRGFGLGDVGEAVSRIVAPAALSGLSRSGGKPLQIRGADALNVPIGLTGEEVIADLLLLEQLLATDPNPELKLLDQLAIVKNPETKSQVEDRLSDALVSGTGSIALAWPHERVDENGTPDSWMPKNLWTGGGNKLRQGQPEWDEVKAALDSHAPERRLARVGQASIQLFRDAEGDEPISQAIPLKRWIAFECDHDGQRYALYDGAWYQLHHDYADNINQRTEAIFSQVDDDLVFPAWASTEDEEAYNKRLATALGGVCLDRKLITTSLHRRGMEACDVYLPDGTLIHVKKTDKSAAVSHLLAQALVSAEALCSDLEARQELCTRISVGGGNPSTFGSKPARIIIAMHRGDGQAITAQSLFTFSKVNLVRQVATLEERGIDVRVISIGACDSVDS